MKEWNLYMQTWFKVFFHVVLFYAFREGLNAPNKLKFLTNVFSLIIVNTCFVVLTYNFFCICMCINTMIVMLKGCSKSRKNFDSYEALVEFSKLNLYCCLLLFKCLPVCFTLTNWDKVYQKVV